MPPVGTKREEFKHFTKAQLASYRQGYRTYIRAAQRVRHDSGGAGGG